jgi:putative endonuclease
LSRQKGDFAEERAVSFLEDAGFSVIDRNYHSRFGEIDIIAQQDNVLHFIEVKSGEGEPVYKITPSKLSKIIKTAMIYMQKKRLDQDYCFDAVIVTEEIEFIGNITL